MYRFRLNSKPVVCLTTACCGAAAVSAEPLAGFEVVERFPYSSWLEDEPTAVYLLRRQGG